MSTEGISAAEPPSTASKRELAVTLGWSRPTLDRRIETDPGFPVVSRGDRGGGWRFDVEAVQSYLAAKGRAANLTGAAAGTPPEPTPSEEHAVQRVGKKALAVELGWSRPTLDRRLERDPAFPVLRRGDQSGGWEFDLDAVLAYLGIEKRSAPIGEPIPAAVASAPPALETPNPSRQAVAIRILSREQFVAAAEPMRPRGRWTPGPIIVRREGLSDDQFNFLAERFNENLSSEFRLSRSLEFLEADAVEAAGRTQFAVYDRIDAALRPPLKLTVGEACHQLTIYWQAWGALLDVAEKMVLEHPLMTPTQIRDGRSFFDGWRAQIVEMLCAKYVAENSFH